MSDRSIPPNTNIPFTSWLRELAHEYKPAEDLVVDMDADIAIAGQDLTADELYNHMVSQGAQPIALDVVTYAAREGGYPLTRG